MFLYSTLVSTHVTVIILSIIPILMVLYVSVQHTGEYTRDCYYIICSSYINGFVYLYSTLVSTHVTVIILFAVPILMVLYVSVQHTGEYTHDC